MKKDKKKSPAEKLARKKRIFRLFERVIAGTAKVWFNGTSYIVAIDELDAFCKEQIEAMKK